MPTLENDSLVFRFPQVEEEASFSIDFQRTLRIPDSERTYALPPGLGQFPLRHAEDYSAKLPAVTAERGGVILPMWQAEALWLRFSNSGPAWDLDFPVAIKVAAGKINAVTGEGWRSGLHREPQDYMVSPGQPWLDGFAVEKGMIRQFVAMPLGDGYSTEEQLSGKAEWGGLQIAVVPLKREVWKRKRKRWESRRAVAYSRLASFDAPMPVMLCEGRDMGLAPGGRMKQSIYEDTFRLEDWDVDSADRVLVTLLNAEDWKSVTGEAAPNHPPSAAEYSAAGLPWFDYYAADQEVIGGAATLAGLTSVGAQYQHKTGAVLPESADVKTGPVTPLTPKPCGFRMVRDSESWDQA